MLNLINEHNHYHQHMGVCIKATWVVASINLEEITIIWSIPQEGVVWAKSKWKFRDHENETYGLFVNKTLLNNLHSKTWSMYNHIKFKKLVVHHWCMRRYHTLEPIPTADNGSRSILDAFTTYWVSFTKPTLRTILSHDDVQNI